ncbi:MAG: site-specific integrase [SAR324 cluster bacterium]|nr:site-specific integrase [SAR324 cluster bacterium]
MEKRCYSQQEFEALEQHILSRSLRDATIFRIGFDTNLSVSDLLSLKTSDVIRLGDIKSTLQIKTRRGPVREVHLSEKSVELLDFYTEQLLDEDGDFFYLFESRSKKGEPLSNGHWNRIIKNYCEELGIGEKSLNKSSAQAKETASSQKIENKLEVIQNFLNRKNPSITTKSKQEALSSLKSLLKKAPHKSFSYPPL